MKEKEREPSDDLEHGNCFSLVSRTKTTAMATICSTMFESKRVDLGAKCNDSIDS